MSQDSVTNQCLSLPENCPRLLRNVASGNTVENDASPMDFNDVLDQYYKGGGLIRIMMYMCT